MKQGGNTGTIAYTPGTLKRIEEAHRRQEARWARLCGPVTVTYLSPEELAERRAARSRKRSGTT